MPWYYAANGTQTGPVDDSQFDALVAAGAINATTLVWRDGMAAWQPYGSVAAASAPAAPPMPGNAGAKCSNCGGTFSSDNLVQIGGSLVCSTCKPIVVQRLKEGASPTATSETPEDLERRGISRQTSVGSCISRGWELTKNNFWPVLGVSLLVLLAMGAAGAVPFLGTCISLVVTGPLLGGLYYYFLKQIRGEQPAVGDAFAGFSSHFVQLMLASLVTSLLIYLPLLPLLGFIIAQAAISRGEPELNAITITLGVLAFPAMFYLTISWMFTLPLVIDKGMKFWPAMGVSRRVVNAHLGTFILLMIAVFGLMLLGLVALCVGVLVMMPITFAAYMYAYEDLFAASPASAG